MSQLYAKQNVNIFFKHLNHFLQINYFIVMNNSQIIFHKKYGKDTNSNLSLSQRATLKIVPHIDSLGWIRVLIKDNQKVTLDFKGLLTADHFSNQFKFKDFGVSNSEQTMNTEESWYFQNVKLSCGIVKNLPQYPPTYQNPDLINLNQIIANVFNGKTPTGTAWSLEYNEGYLFYGGIIKTYGKWQKFWMGQTQDPYVKIGANTSLRSGGAVHHTGQFIHSSCNGYKDIDHSVTSRWDWKNKRVFWIRL